MGFWSELLGIAPPPAPAPEPAPPAMPAEPARLRGAARHVARFERAIEQSRVAIANGESTAERLAELERWHRYWSQLAALEGEFGGELVAAEEGDD